MTYNLVYFEVRSLNDTFGLGSTFNCPGDALDYINQSYNRALELGYNNSHKEWLILRCERTKVFSPEDVFCGEQTSRELFSYAKYSPDSKCYIAL